MPNFPRLRALALFGRRPVERAEPPCCRRPKTCTKAEGRSGLVSLWTDDRQGGLTWFSVRITGAEILDAIGVLQALAFLAPRDAVLEGHNRLSMLNWRGLFSRRGLRGLLTGRWANEECQQKEDGSASHLGTLTLKDAGRVRGLQCRSLI